MNALLSPGHSLRPMRNGDLDAVIEVERLAYPFPWTRGNFIDSLVAEYVVEVMVDARGLLLGYYVAMPGVDELHLLNVTVHPAWQNRGLGRALLAAVRTQAQQRQLACLWLEVRESNQRARALYLRLGFAEVGRRRGYYPAGEQREDALVMRLPLAAVESA